MSNEVAIVMGSDSDWPTMSAAADVLNECGIKFEKDVVSAHRTPEEMLAFAKGAAAKGLKVIIAGAGDRKSTRLNSSHIPLSRMPSSA